MNGINATTLPTYFPPAQYFTNIGSVANLFIRAATLGAAVIFLAMMLWAGYLYLTGGGEAENIAKAQKTATWGVVGLILVVLSYTIVRIIALVFRVEMPL